MNETTGYPVDASDVNKQPIYTGVLDDVFVVGSPTFQICSNKRYCDLYFGLTNKIYPPDGMSQLVSLSQDIQDEDEDINIPSDIFKMTPQGRLGRTDGSINKPYGYLIQSFKDMCEQYHGNATRSELEEVKNYMESKMWAMKQKIFNSTKGSVIDGNKMSDGVYVSSNVLFSKRRKTDGTIHM